MGRYLYLTSVILAFISITGCGEDTERWEEPPQVLSVNIGDGWEISSDISVSVTFSKQMDDSLVIIALNGVPVPTTSHDGMKFNFLSPGKGEYELSINGKDMHGQPLVPPYEPISFTAIGADSPRMRCNDFYAKALL